MLFIKNFENNPKNIKNDTQFKIDPKDIDAATSIFVFALSEDENGNEITHQIKIEKIKAADFYLLREPELLPENDK